MIKETDENDQELISFVRSLIHQPSKKLYNVVDKRKIDFSGDGQSVYVDKILKSKRNGFFIEAGGYTGEEGSNTLYFEKERNWTGILIEPLPLNFKKILTKNRKCFVINCCIANKIYTLYIWKKLKITYLSYCIYILFLYCHNFVILESN